MFLICRNIIDLVGILIDLIDTNSYAMTMSAIIDSNFTYELLRIAVHSYTGFCKNSVRCTIFNVAQEMQISII